MMVEGAKSTIVQEYWWDDKQEKGSYIPIWILFGFQRNPYHEYYL